MQRQKSVSRSSTRISTFRRFLSFVVQWLSVIPLMEQALFGIGVSFSGSHEMSERGKGGHVFFFCCCASVSIWSRITLCESFGFRDCPLDVVASTLVRSNVGLLFDLFLSPLPSHFYTQKQALYWLASSYSPSIG